MSLIYYTVAVLIIALVIGLVVYGRKRRTHLLRVLGSLDENKIQIIFEGTYLELKGAYPQLDITNFQETALFLEREFRPSNDRLFSALPKRFFDDDFADYWVLDLGIFLGELVRQHSPLSPDWKKDRDGVWRLFFNLSSGEHYAWNPFEEAERRYTGRIMDLAVSLNLLLCLK